MLEEGASTVAAESYVRERMKEFPFPNTPRQFQLLMEIAFIEGAQWYNEHRLTDAQTRLDALKQEAANA